MGIGRTNIGGGKWWFPEYDTPALVQVIPANYNQPILVNNVDTSKRYFYRISGQAGNGLASFEVIDLQAMWGYVITTSADNQIYINTYTPLISDITANSFKIMPSTSAQHLEGIGVLKIKDSSFK